VATTAGQAQEDDTSRSEPTIEITPSAQQVAPGGELSYTIRVRAPREVAAQRVRVLLSFSRGQLVPGTTRFEERGDWVSRLTENELTVTFGAFEANEQRRGTIVFQVDPSLANYASIQFSARYDWRTAPSPSATPTATPAPADDHEDEPTIRLDVLDVTVLSPNAPPPRTDVWPSAAPAGTAFQFHAVNFAPNEPFVTWLNAPDGVRPLPNQGTATASGEIWVGLESTGLRPGAYSLVIFGLRSQQTGVGPFVVQ
jgi:hypothetical protein